MRIFGFIIAICFFVWVAKILISLTIETFSNEIFVTSSFILVSTLILMIYLIRRWAIESSREQIDEAPKKEIKNMTEKNQQKPISLQLLEILSKLEMVDEYFFEAYSEAGSIFKGTDFEKVKVAVNEARGIYAISLKKLNNISHSNSSYCPIRVMRIMLEGRIQSLSDIEKELPTKHRPLIDNLVYHYRNYIKSETIFIEKIREKIEKDL